MKRRFVLNEDLKRLDKEMKESFSIDPDRELKELEAQDNGQHTEEEKVTQNES